MILRNCPPPPRHHLAGLGFGNMVVRIMGALFTPYAIKRYKRAQLGRERVRELPNRDQNTATILCDNEIDLVLTSTEPIRRGARDQNAGN